MRAFTPLAALAVLAIAVPASAFTQQTAASGASPEDPDMRLESAGSSLQGAVMRSSLRMDGSADDAGDGAVSFGYLTSTSAKDPATAGAQREFDNELPNVRTPGVVTYGPGMRAHAVATPQGK
jgi:phosphatidate phosphatase APP1